MSSPAKFLPTPPPDTTDGERGAAKQHEADQQNRLESWRQFREDVTLDFAAFESSIARIQFLLTSNEKERSRYAEEKLKILSTAQSVKDNTAELRTQLEEAQKMLALRKTYDELAEKITSNRLLRPREDQQANLEKLHAEIAKLEMESREYAKTWSERREQFGRIVEEGMNLRRLIRDEKEEVERREGMEEGEEGDEGEVGTKSRTSIAGTPRPERDGATPSLAGHEEPGQIPLGGTQVDKLRAGAALDGASPLRHEVNITSPENSAPQENEDENMVDEGEVTGDELPPEPSTTVGTRSTSRAGDTHEEGEDRSTEKMDTT